MDEPTRNIERLLECVDVSWTGARERRVYAQLVKRRRQKRLGRVAATATALTLATVAMAALGRQPAATHADDAGDGLVHFSDGSTARIGPSGPVKPRKRDRRQHAGARQHQVARLAHDFIRARQC